jgi:hypothetical protein
MTDTATRSSGGWSPSDLPEPWEQLPDEGAKAFDAFVSYRDRAAGDRSIAKAAGGRPEGGARSAKVRSFESRKRQMEKWSVEHAWVHRARMWDEHRDRVRRIGELQAIEEMGREHAKAGDLLVAKGLAALEAIDPVELPYSDLLRYITEGARLARLARGEPEMTGEFTDTSAQDTIRALLMESPDVAKAAAMLSATASKARRDREKNS